MSAPCRMALPECIYGISNGYRQVHTHTAAAEYKQIRQAFDGLVYLINRATGGAVKSFTL